MGKIRLASRARTNAVIYLAMGFPAVFDGVEKWVPLDGSDTADPNSLTPVMVPPKFALVFKDAPRWWDWGNTTDAPIHVNDDELRELKKWSEDLKVEMRDNKREGERKSWVSDIVVKCCTLWAEPAGVWDNEVRQRFGR